MLLGKMMSAVTAGVVLLALVGPGAVAQTIPTSQQQISLSFAPLVKQVAPAVVNVFTKRVVREQARSPFANDPFFQRFFGDRFSFGMPRERVQSSLGSGVIVRADGIIVTNNHVIANGDTFTVALSDRREFEAEVLLADERTDLAILKIDTKGEALPALAFGDSDGLEVGDLVLAIGNPFGVGQTVTSGIVSALARTQVGVTDYQFFIQTDAAINPGNSGGALVTMDGRLVGVNTAIFSRTGGSIGIGFAIPANMVRLVVASAADGNNGRVVRPWLGASVQTVTSELSQSLGLDRPGGVLIGDIYDGGPADKAGLATGDVVRRLDVHDVVDENALSYRLATREVGSSVSIEFLRGGIPRTGTLVLTAPPERPARDVTQLDGPHPFAGATVANLSPALAEELRLDAMQSGVVVTEIVRRSPANRLGVQPGDIILGVNNERVENVDALERALSRASGVGNWQVSVKRGDQVFNTTVRL
ncbi:DegQ family serine endoprotease [Pyruvatibacter sp.]|uniref:DegQ family serine endoprotease n=1 Tax=Pyruvatibacter sp. TaxID=1981328 RepID=UPI0032EEDD42